MTRSFQLEPRLKDGPWSQSQPIWRCVGVCHCDGMCTYSKSERRLETAVHIKAEHRKVDTECTAVFPSIRRPNDGVLVISGIPRSRILCFVFFLCFLFFLCPKRRWMGLLTSSVVSCQACYGRLESDWQCYVSLGSMDGALDLVGLDPRDETVEGGSPNEGKNRMDGRSA